MPAPGHTVLEPHWGGPGIEIFTLGEGFTNISAFAFKNSSDLKQVTIPASVTSLENNAFSESALLKVTFPGNAPACDDLAFSSVLEDFTVYYFDGAAGFTSPLWKGVPAVNMGASTPANLWKVRNDIAHDTPMGADPDGDGIKLLMAYALGLDPHRAGVADLPPVEVSGTTLAMTFQSGVPGITYQVETSDDLVDWTDEGVVLSPPDAAQLRTATYAGPGGARFMRLVVRE